MTEQTSFVWEKRVETPPGSDSYYANFRVPCFVTEEDWSKIGPYNQKKLVDRLFRALAHEGFDATYIYFEDRWTVRVSGQFVK